MPGISFHAIDITQAVPAKGLQIEIFKLESHQRNLVVRTEINETGNMVDAVELADSGTYEVVAFVGEYFRNHKLDLPEPPFMDVVPFRFGIADSKQHYHLPFKFTPWGFSLFRGG